MTCTGNLTAETRLLIFVKIVPQAMMMGPRKSQYTAAVLSDMYCGG
jgi:hypothetical protein